MISELTLSRRKRVCIIGPDKRFRSDRPPQRHQLAPVVI
jgi:hypothetical protein